MAGFVRRFLFDPGNEVITQIEGIVIIDRAPPASITGLFNGTATIVAEWEDGAFDVPTEVASANDLETKFGSFGFTYDGIPHNNVTARTRLADGALTPEFWNGNGFVAVANKRFARLILVRADTSVGEMAFTRLACSEGNTDFEWDLEPAQTLVLDIGAGDVTATFDATIGTVTSGAGVFPTTFVGGETMRVGVDVGTDQEIITDIVFLATDQSQAQAIIRMNAALGYTAFTDAGVDTTMFDGRKRGTSGNVEIISQDASVGTALGFVVASTAGTGDVADIDKVTFAEVKALVEADVTGTIVERTPSGKLRICNTATSGTPTIVVQATSTALAFGFALGVVNTAAAGLRGVVPAGTRVRNVGGDEWVTMQTIQVQPTVTDYTVKIRPAVDDGTGLAAVAGTIDTLPFAVELAGFGVINPLPVSAALTEAQIDARYLTAIDSTLNPNNVARETNLIVSARHSNAIRGRLRVNALDASANGLRGRIAFIRPPLKTSRVIAKSDVTQPGVGAYRNQRAVYCYPGASTFLPQIAERGIAGGDGFTVDGIIDTGFDTWCVSLTTQLPPEENPGQDTPFIAGIVAIELGNTDVQSLSLNDYISFKSSGIAALQVDAGNFLIASGVTSVDPDISPNLKNISRRRMADFIQDTLAVRMKAFNKKLATIQRRSDIVGEVTAFLNGLLSLNNPSSQRIDSFSVDGISGNTPEGIAAGIFRLIIKVRTLASLDFIVLDTEVGESVVVQEAA